MNDANEPRKTYGNDNGTNKNKTWIIAGLILLIVVLGVSLYFNYSQNKENAFMEAELDDTYQQLESMRSELDSKIVEIERLGGDVEELRIAREEMDMQLEELKNNNQMAWSQYNRIKNRVEGYRELLILKDQEIDKLKQVNEVLLTENTTLKEEKNQLNDSINQLATTRNKLEEKVEIASRLKAEDIKVFAVNRRGKEREGEFRARQIEQLKVEFSIAENDVAPIEGKDILIRVLEPEGNVLFDVARGSGTFMYNGKEEFYTAKQEILFDNTGQQLTFQYEKGSEFIEGQHTVEIYTDGYIMGSETFVVK